MLITFDMEKLKRNFAFTNCDDLLSTLKIAAGKLTHDRSNFTAEQERSARMLALFINCLEVRDSEISNTLANLIELTKEKSPSV